jgi:hypothetical protein
MKITINEPCHENWDAMTPNTQGAFCKSCAKDVVDFSNKSLNQIKNFFSQERTEKVCARFKEEQLQELSVDDFVSKFQYWNITKRFAAIFFMVLGLTLFSPNNGMAQGAPMVNGGVSYNPDKNPKKDTTKKQTNPPKDIKMGKVKCTNPNTQQQTTKGEAKILMGDVAAPPKEEPKIMGVMTVPNKEKQTPPKKKDN